ncbi:MULTISPECIES: hypothetical protein [unclassified Streptomyces]|uniref:hypothetical protein n=1 Tax=unclassified Streptomyces TaxID=2593676 RepID=UPI002DDBDA66|nr:MULTISPECIES: hypothetical protein [unclassified Streptomyces]WSB77139.1 hypothetical protein OHB04_16095 [Streptomyces sp. NBC_01775]WSS14596.1 hypothetical protein OG533_23880 [Streptomyces sp. NBC_01186]WSS43410.1 hypothetical protein OG220_24550 [Streptomyces sp. NBC_01187]
MSRPTAGTARGRRAPLALACAALGLVSVSLLSGCGIRATSVPVDAGAAPSQVGCVLPDGRESPEAGDGVSVVRVYLVCGSRVAPVEREVRMPGGRSSAERLPVARKLLEELKHQPHAMEESAGFETAVPEGLTISAAGRDDPDEALRLSTPLDELPSFALAQIVCTFADTAAADADNGVVIGGPGEDGDQGGEDGDGGKGDGKDPGGSSVPLQRFECGTALRNSPEAAESAGTRV